MKKKNNLEGLHIKVYEKCDICGGTGALQTEPYNLPVKCLYCEKGFVDKFVLLKELKDKEK